MHKATHVIIASFYRDNRGVAETFAHPFGVNSKVPSSWGRPKASDANPHGTGQGNPLDQAERLINLVHPIDPARAREMAQNFVSLVDDLDHSAGVEQAREKLSWAEALARSICEHSDIAGALLKDSSDRGTYEAALREIHEAKSALQKLEGAIYEFLEAEVVKE